MWEHWWSKMIPSLDSLASSLSSRASPQPQAHQPPLIYVKHLLRCIHVFLPAARHFSSVLLPHFPLASEETFPLIQMAERNKSLGCLNHYRGIPHLSERMCRMLLPRYFRNGHGDEGWKGGGRTMSRQATDHGVWLADLEMVLLKAWQDSVLAFLEKLMEAIASLQLVFPTLSLLLNHHQITNH